MSNSLDPRALMSAISQRLFGADIGPAGTQLTVTDAELLQTEAPAAPQLTLTLTWAGPFGEEHQHVATLTLGPAIRRTYTERPPTAGRVLVHPDKAAYLGNLGMGVVPGWLETATRNAQPAPADLTFPGPPTAAELSDRARAITAAAAQTAAARATTAPRRSSRA